MLVTPHSFIGEIGVLQFNPVDCGSVDFSDLGLHRFWLLFEDDCALRLLLLTKKRIGDVFLNTPDVLRKLGFLLVDSNVDFLNRLIFEVIDNLVGSGDARLNNKPVRRV